MKRVWGVLTLCCVLSPLPGAAFDLSLPEGARQTGAETLGPSAFSLPIAPYSQGTVPTRDFSGVASSTSWTFPIGQIGTAGLMELIRIQVVEQGYQPLISCHDRRCGGFDFRFQLALLPEPEMHVDLGDYRYLAASKEDADAPNQYVQIVVSRSRSNAFVQITEYAERTAEAPELTVTSTKTPDVVGLGLAGSVRDNLLANGFAVLGDLTFETGKATLGQDDYVSISELARFMQDNPDITIALVGHTDAEGRLAPNVALSRKRAQSVMSRLVKKHGIPQARLEAEGVGYLSPRSSNQTDETRQQNRRVEAIITSTR